MSRVHDRADFDEPTRLRLLEGDLDRADKKFNTIFEKIDSQTRSMSRQTLSFIGLSIGVLTLAGAIVFGAL